MKKYIFIIAAALFSFVCNAQVVEDEEGLVPAVQSQRDSILATVNEVPVVELDSALLGRSVFAVMPNRNNGDKATVSVNQSREIAHAFASKVEANSFKEVSGYRIRIYFSNAQNAREESMAAVVRFKEKYAYPVYHSFVNPNFKVTVGDFRSKSEALGLLERVKRDFPSAFIVKENISLRY